MADYAHTDFLSGDLLLRDNDPKEAVQWETILGSSGSTAITTGIVLVSGLSLVPAPSLVPC